MALAELVRHAPTFALFMRKRPARATIDFEARSPANIRNGAWLYAKNKHTRILCLSFLLPDQDPLYPSIWAPPMGGEPAFEEFTPDPKGGYFDLERLFAHIREGGLVEAHNVFFESCMWEHIATRPVGHDANGATGMGAPPVKDTQWRCSAAKCAALALPRGLEDAGLAWGLPPHLRKDPVGGKTMLRLSKPRKPRKGEPKVDEYGALGFDPGEEILYYPEYLKADFLTLYRYCQRDVTAEHSLSEDLPDLDPREYQVWLADYRANRRGVLIDMELVNAAISMDARLKAKMNRALESMTGIARVTERAKILEWLAENGVVLPDSAAPTLDHLMASSGFDKLAVDVQEVIRLTRNGNRTSITKYKRIKQCVDPDDGRVRELVMYHGAATGRWSGKGIQVQNLPKGNLDSLIKCDGGTVKQADVVRWIKEGAVDWLECLFGDALSALSSCLRGTLIPSAGKVFYVADYAAIEARVVLWLAGAKTALEVFLRGEDIYMDMATGIYGYPVTDKKKQSAERAFGKVAVLGLGYGMGWITFLLTLRTYNIKFTKDEAIRILGDKKDKYINGAKKALWPEKPVQKDGEDKEDFVERVRKYKTAKANADKILRRLVDEREDPKDILEELALCKFTVDAYRERYPEVKHLWRDQESAAVEAVVRWRRAKKAYDEAWEVEKAKAHRAAALGEDYYVEQPPMPALAPVVCGYVTWVVEGRFLFCYLPSGRRIAYCDPDVKGTKTPWGDTNLSLRFMGVHKKTRKWARMGSYGGSLVENIDQGTARDMMADALVRIEHALEGDFTFELIASIHDEGLTEGEDDGIDHHKGLEALMETLEPCYAGCPVKAEGAQLVRYAK